MATDDVARVLAQLFTASPAAHRATTADLHADGTPVGHPVAGHRRSV